MTAGSQDDRRDGILTIARTAPSAVTPLAPPGAARAAAQQGREAEAEMTEPETSGAQMSGAPAEAPPKGPGPIRRTLSILRPHLGGHKALLGAGALAMLMEVAFRVLEPWPVKIVVDALTVSLGAEIPGGGPPATIQLLLAAMLATVAIVGLRAICNYLATVAFALGGSRIATALRQRVFDHVASLSKSYHTRSRSGDLVQRLVGDVGKLQEVAVTAGLPLAVNVVTLVVMSIVMAWLDIVLAGVVLLAALAFLLLSKGSTRKITTAARKTRRSEGDLANVAQETLGAIPVVQAYALESWLSRRFSGSNAKSLKDGVQSKRLAAGLERSTDVVVGVSTGLVIFFGGWRVLQGQMSPGDLVIFLTYLKSAMKPLRDLAKYTGRISRAAASGERIADVLDQVPDIVSPPDAVPLPHARGALELRGVQVEHLDGVPVLSGLDLQIPAGQRLAVVGPSGSGKSTLVSLFPRLLDPVRGQVLLDGHDLRDLVLEDVRSHVTLVLQDSVLFTGTIMENIRHGRPGATDEEVVAAARRAHAHAFIQAQPEGYDTVVGERGSTLSGGQRQRVAIARAMLRDSAIIVLDEATTGLDAASAAAVEEGLAELSRGRTTVVITHDEATARSCDRIVWIEGGRVRWDGPPDGQLPGDAAFEPQPGDAAFDARPGDARPAEQVDAPAEQGAEGGDRV